jgi:hypothetical protein
MVALALGFVTPARGSKHGGNPHHGERETLEALPHLWLTFSRILKGDSMILSSVLRCDAEMCVLSCKSPGLERRIEKRLQNQFYVYRGLKKDTKTTPEQLITAQYM